MKTVSRYGWNILGRGLCSRGDASLLQGQVLDVPAELVDREVVGDGRPDARDLVEHHHQSRAADEEARVHDRLDDRVEEVRSVANPLSII